MSIAKAATIAFATVLACALAGIASPAECQTDSDRRGPKRATAPNQVIVPPGCVNVNASTRQQLEQRQRSLEEALLYKRKQLQDVKDFDVKRKGLEASISETEQKLTDIVYQIECLRFDWRTPPAPGEPVYINAYYATNRKRNVSATVPAEAYGPEQIFDAPEYGRVVVTIPSNRSRGEIERPSLWKLELERAPDAKAYVLLSITSLDHAAAMAELRGRASAAMQRAILLFVHGFNSSFSETAIRTAQLAYDLRFPGLAIFFSWPASGNYSRDEETIELAKRPFSMLLDDLGQLPYDDIYVIAHSMGTRLVAKEIAERQQRGADVRKIRELLLAAPDINADIFKYQIAPAFAELQSMRRTIYASSNDVALKVSRSLRGYRRVGETSNGVLVYPGFETVDSSAAAPMKRAYGHSYVFDSIPVLSDVAQIIVHRANHAVRGLTQSGTPPELYWVLG